jgi:hypothetical protein
MWFSEDMQASFESSFPRYIASCLLSIDETDLSKLLKEIGWMVLMKKKCSLQVSLPYFLGQIMVYKIVPTLMGPTVQLDLK